MNQSKKTLVVGASEKPYRYANKAIRRLVLFGHEVVPLAPRPGQVEGISFVTGTPRLKGIHTITLYVGPDRQSGLYDYLLSLNPKRIIFNPGTENIAFIKKARKQGIETIENCTLVMLETGTF